MLLKGLRSIAVQALKSTKKDVNKLQSNCIFFKQSRFLHSTDDPNEFAKYAESDPQNDSGNTEVTNESEMMYFSGQSTNMKVQNLQKRSLKSVSMKHSLSHTNKSLFGPLLETASEKKRRLKREKAELSKNHKSVKKKAKVVHKSKEDFQPLIYRPENSHNVGIFPSDEPRLLLKLKKHVPTEILTFHENDDHSTDFLSNAKTLVYKDNTKMYPRVLATENKSSKPKKLVVSSWDQYNEKKDTLPSASSGSTSSFQQETKHNANSDAENTPEECENEIDNSQIHMQSDKTNMKEYGFTSNVMNESSYILLDNSKFSAVPKSLNISMIEEFPLFQRTSSDIHAPLAGNPFADNEQNISTIGIFDGGYKKLPSVRNILEATMPEAQRKILEKWKAKMIRELGEEGFEQYRKGLLDRGMLFHGCIQSHLSGVTPSVEDLPSISGLWTSLKTVLPNVTNVRALESRLIHPHLHYQGALDCVGLYRGTPVLIEWKTSSKPKLSVKSMFDDPLQVTAYLGALNFDENYQLPYQADSALLVVAYDSGLPANVHSLNTEYCKYYWKLWCSRLIQFWKQLEQPAEPPC